MLIYITTADKEQARAIGKALVETKLAACVNIIENMNSMYMWQGELQDDKEVILIAKTTEPLVPELVATVKTLHSYDCPCILSFEVSGGNESFLEWIANEVKRGKK
jgi:periplasmic divalent cation tolerance protein